MTGYGLQGPSDDPSNRPTRMASYDPGDLQSTALDEYAEAAEPAESPKHRNPKVRRTRGTGIGYCWSRGPPRSRS